MVIVLTLPLFFFDCFDIRRNSFENLEILLNNMGKVTLDLIKQFVVNNRLDVDKVSFLLADFYFRKVMDAAVNQVKIISPKMRNSQIPSTRDLALISRISQNRYKS